MSEIGARSPTGEYAEGARPRWHDEGALALPDEFKNITLVDT